LNTSVTDWIFRRIAKPKDAGWFEANKQFIAPLPVPDATSEQRTVVANHARELQRLHTVRQRLLERISRRLGTVRRRTKPDAWLFRDLAAPSIREADAPPGLDIEKRCAWAKTTFEIDLTARLSALATLLKPGTILDASLSEDGELRFTADDQVVVDKIFVDATEGEFLLAQWKTVASTFTMTEKANGKRLSQALRTLASSDDGPLVAQVVVAVDELQACEAAIGLEEKSIDAVVSSLFRLTVAEKALIKVR
jgi:hypothetical protein